MTQVLIVNNIMISNDRRTSVKRVSAAPECQRLVYDRSCRFQASGMNSKDMFLSRIKITAFDELPFSH